jgi:MoxR-like ATPases
MSESDIDTLQEKIKRARTEVGERIVGQDDVLEQLFVCILADGNALLESNPGLGKTTMVRTVAEVTDLGFSRIQNTPDLMPSDITGTEIIRENAEGREFVFEKGPVFANVVLADEINRATPKTQAALLEAMQERQVTAGGETYQLPDPFFILATQNPSTRAGPTRCRRHRPTGSC